MIVLYSERNLPPLHSPIPARSPPCTLSTTLDCTRVDESEWQAFLSEATKTCSTPEEAALLDSFLRSQLLSNLCLLHLPYRSLCIHGGPSSPTAPCTLSCKEHSHPPHSPKPKPWLRDKMASGEYSISAKRSLSLDPSACKIRCGCGMLRLACGIWGSRKVSRRMYVGS
jgi:hypothetical protein